MHAIYIFQFNKILFISYIIHERLVKCLCKLSHCFRSIQLIYSSKRIVLKSIVSLSIFERS